MNTYRQFLSILALLVILPVLGLKLAAQDDDDQSYSDQSADVATAPAPDAGTSASQDAPARAARLQYMSGSVSVQPQGTGEWIAGQLNRPLTNADNIWADKNSKAEISVGTGLIRIDSESSLTLTNIGENTVQLSLHQGAMNLHVRRLYDNETYEVDTPNQAFTVLKPGDYRFDVDSDSDKTVITVWRGEGESSANGQTVKIRENQQARFDQGTFSADDIHAAPSPDSFDEWARSRDEKLDHSVSARYVSPDVVGYEDLDEYGNWKHSDEYGDVWVPNDVAPGWAPYTSGHWIWENPWGWTWVDYDPWGYAPFHYGRWVYWGGYWGWAPGPIWVRPYYAPALVAWFGGPGWGVSVGFGGGYGYGWCPLGWGEPYIPWYHASYGYFRGVNITNTRITNVNITNIYNNNFINGRPRPGGGIYGGHGGDGHGGDGHGGGYHYANMRAPGGFTAVSRNTLVNSLPVAHNNIRVAPNQLSRMTPVRAVDARPTRTTMLGGHMPSRVAPPPHAFSRPVVSRDGSPINRGNAGFRTNGGVGRPEMGNARGVQNAGTVARGVQRPDNMPRGANASPSMNRGGVPPEVGGARSIPHPPTAGGFENRGGLRPASAGMRPTGPTESARSTVPAMRPQSVPRPPSASMPRGGDRGGDRPAMNAPRGNAGSQMNAPRGERPQMGTPRGPSRGDAPRGNGPRSEMNVPRPPNSSAPRGYSSAADRGSYSNSRSESSYQANNRPYTGSNYGRPESSYGRPERGNSRPSPSYSRPTPSYGGSYGRSMPSYDRGSYGRSTPSYGGGSYGRPAPSYGGGNYGRPAPSYGGGGNYSRSMPAYGGGGYGGGRAPSYGGVGGGRSYGGGGGYGGGHVSGGGGGHVSGGGGGGHSGGGSRSGHR